MPFLLNDLYLAAKYEEFPISLLDWNQFSFSKAFFWGLQIASSHLRPVLENKLAAKAIQSAIHVVLPSLRSTCDTVHCLGERALSSSSFVAVFWRFLPSNTPTMLYNIRYWWFFLSQGNRWTKYLAYVSQNTEAKTLPADVCVFGRFGRLTPTAVLSTDCRFDFEVKWWIHVSSILTYLYKTPFLLLWNSCKQRSESSTHCCLWSTVSKRGTHFEHSFLIDKCSCKMVNSLPFDIFNSSAISCNFNLRSAKMSLWSFFVFSMTTAEFGWPGIQHHLCLYDRI